MELFLSSNICLVYEATMENSEKLRKTKKHYTAGKHIILNINYLLYIIMYVINFSYDYFWSDCIHIDDFLLYGFGLPPTLPPGKNQKIQNTPRKKL